MADDEVHVMTRLGHARPALRSVFDSHNTCEYLGHSAPITYQLPTAAAVKALSPMGPPPTACALSRLQSNHVCHVPVRGLTHLHRQVQFLHAPPLLPNVTNQSILLTTPTLSRSPFHALTSRPTRSLRNTRPRRTILVVQLPVRSNSGQPSALPLRPA